MKKVLMVLFTLTGFISQAQVVTPSGSPGSTLTSVVGLTEVKVEYSRPRAKGRKIFGEGSDFVTPYNHMWRTGANQGTIVTFSDDVKFGGTDVPKGSYKLFIIPTATQWTAILTKDLTLNGNDPEGYDQKNDQARAIAKSEKLTEKVETFTIQISDIADNNKSANLQVSWENTTAKFPITVDFDKKVQASIDANTKVNPNNLYSAANYYLENGKDLKIALEWITTAAAARPDAYWMMHTKARIQQALGDKKGAMDSATASKTVAAKGNDAAYVKMNDDLIKVLK